MPMIDVDNFGRAWKEWNAHKDKSWEFTFTCEHDDPILSDTLNKWNVSKDKSSELTITLEPDGFISSDIFNKLCGLKGENTNMPIYYGTRNSAFGMFAITEKAIKKVIFNPPATIILWSDGMKTVVKCREGDTFDRQTGFAMAVLKKIYGEKYHHILRKYAPEEVEDVKEEK